MAANFAFQRNMLSVGIGWQFHLCHAAVFYGFRPSRGCICKFFNKQWKDIGHIARQAG